MTIDTFSDEYTSNPHILWKLPGKIEVFDKNNDYFPHFHWNFHLLLEYSRHVHELCYEYPMDLKIPSNVR